MTTVSAEWDDFYLAPKVGASFVDIAGAIGFVPFTLFDVDASSVNGAVIRLEWDGPAGSVAEIGLDYEMPSEFGGGGTFTRTLIYLADSAPVHVPLSANSPLFHLVVVDASALPGLLTAKYVSREEGGGTLTIAGASPAVTGSDTVGAISDLDIEPAIAIPGQVSIYLATDSPNYDVYLRTWKLSGAFDIPLADEANPLPISASITVPAGSWSIRFVNNDASPCDVRYSLIYQQ